MNKAYKVALAFLAVSLIMAAILTSVVGEGDYEVFMIILGLICLVGGIMLSVTALIISFTSKSEWSKPLLLASAISLLVGTGVCGSIWVGM